MNHRVALRPRAISAAEDALMLVSLPSVLGLALILSAGAAWLRVT